MNMFLNMADFELRKAIREIDEIPEGECHPDALQEREEMVEALRVRENWS